MIYLETTNENKVCLTHYQPFHEKYGLGKTKEELELTGIFVESLPLKLEEQQTKIQALYVNPLRWEYVDRELSKEEKLDKMVEDGILTQEQANDLR